METDMQVADPEIQELKQEVEELRAVSEDTNRVVHKMRRGIWWGRLWTAAWWMLIFGVSGAAYYYYAQPIISEAQQYYTQHQAEAQGFFQQFGGFFSQFLKAPAQQSPGVPQSGPTQ